MTSRRSFARAVTRRAAVVVFSAAFVLSLPGCGEIGNSTAPVRQSAADGSSANSDANPRSDRPATASRDRRPRKNPESVDEEFRARPLKQLSPQQLDEGWVELFDGQTLFGWESANPSVNWRVEDGAIVAEAGGPGLLTTFVACADFELQCDVRLERGGNSGIFLRTPARPRNPSVDCYEWNLCDSHDAFPTASLVGRRAVHGVRIEDDRWHTCRIRFQGPHLKAWIDGRLVTDFREAAQSAGFLRRGFIGLQQNRGRVAFRRIFLKPLGTRPLLPEHGLEGWRIVPGSRSRFSIEDGTLAIDGGPGYLQTKGRWADFALQLEAFVDGARLNSGVFFRALAGTQDAPANGYEVQIHNGFYDGDRSRPVDAGTGAIFRRTVARWVVPDDRQWFHLTLIAVGDRFGVWVEGFPVTMWQDGRPDDPNPRRGRRLQSGHLILQGHDPTTHVRFRRMRIADWSVPESAVGAQRRND
ncbi:MAG: DUF1080 domain-containing protein [Planctomycetota bacterium]|nr:MAG: DUF1080 domain-containing protein [Planctomycetota bacterium]